MNPQDVVTLDTGDVEYSVEKAVMLIDDMIELMENAKEEGATHLVFLSGNYRGAQYLAAPRMYDWLDD